jgi:hypothetical protein
MSVEAPHTNARQKKAATANRRKFDAAHHIRRHAAVFAVRFVTLSRFYAGKRGTYEQPTHESVKSI